MAPSAIAVRRINADVRRVREELGDSGIFWVGDESDITRGWAIVCGTTGTPYCGGVFAFEVVFPDNYPFEPPKFTYLTNDGRTRFNPNLYKNGKVCLSLLNTWQGEQWSGIQSLASVLQCIQSAVLIDHPLHNEPAYAKLSVNEESLMYDRMVFHAVMETAILQVFQQPAPYMVPIHDTLKAWILKHQSEVVQKACELATVYDKKIEEHKFFGMIVRYRFRELSDIIALLE